MTTSRLITTSTAFRSKLIGDSAEARVTASTVEVFFRGRRVAGARGTGPR
jgi:hypothetical protein